jgi:hypothetical protein
MAIAKTTNSTELNNTNKVINIRFICPVCKSEKELPIIKSVINQAKQLTTVSIAKGLVCNHHFQVFIDKNYKVRGYQKVDFEFENTRDLNKNEKSRDLNNSDDNFFEDLIMEENFIKYTPKELKEEVIINQEKKRMTLEQIYEEFWEFIDEDNEQFKDFIKSDIRRNK